jgi:DNA-binding beta-propeller fold protein YncE
MSKKPTLFLLSFLTIVLLISSCGKNENDKPAGAWSKSVFIINEGPFPTGSGSISAFNRETLEITHNLFETANGRPLGNIVQSLTVHHNKAFIVVNNANKIEVVNLEDFKSVATIDNLVQPRYFIGFDEDKGYVSCWDASVKVLNLVDYSVMASVQTGAGPDEMVMSGDRLFVINSGGFGDDSTMSVISTNDEENLGRIIVGHRPSGIRKDINGNIWVLCSGKGYSGFPDPGDTPAKLVCIDPVSLAILKEINFPDTENHPDNLIIDDSGSILYYNHPQGIFSFPVVASALNSQPLIPGCKMYYGLGFDEKLKMIYVTDPLDYQQNGWVFRYDAIDGTPNDSMLVGIVPNGFWFNE